MSESISFLKKKKKMTLLPGWVERFSKKHPDKPYYFNEKTGESRWSMPLNSPEKVMENSQNKAKKRKNSDTEYEEPSDVNENSADQSSSSEISKRPKLKARGSKVAANTIKEVNNDTPAMRIYREKLAQRKAALEKKNKIINKKQNNVSSSSKKNIPSTSQTKKKTQNTSSVTSRNSSNSSTISNTSSISSKIKEVENPINKKLIDLNKQSIEISKNRLSKIPKVQLVKTNSVSLKLNKSDFDFECSTSSTNQILNNINEISKTRRSLRKNIANERLEKFRKSLSLERDKSSPSKHLNKSSQVDLSDSSFDISKLLNSPIPVLYEKAHTRFRYLENHIKNTGLVELNKIKQANNNNNKKQSVKINRILEKIEVADTYEEEMEWEPIEDEKIMSEVYSVRYQLCEKPMEKLSKISCNALQSVDNSGETNSLYIVIDTNVFLSNLSFIEEVRDSHSDIFGRPYIVVPWTVLQELDFIKDDVNHTRSQTLKLKARKAVEFLNQHFTVKHPRFIGQTPSDVEKNKTKFMIECPDDEILQTCLQIKELLKSPVLLSYDKNLCNKAMIHDIPILGRNDPLEKIYYLKAAESTQFLSNSLHTTTDDRQKDVSITQKELLAADDIMEEGKALIKSILSEVIEVEMRNLFGDRWEMHVIIRPPWSVVAALKCALKHWMAAVSESFQRKTESVLRDILECINNAPTAGRKLQDVKFFLDKCNDVIQTLSVKKYPNLKCKSLTIIDDLKQRCLNTIDEISKIKFNESVGSEENTCEEEKRASFAFKVLENIYAFARDVCGMAAEAFGLQCSFSYNKFHPFLTTKRALQHQQVVGMSVNRLLQILRMILSKANDGMDPNDKMILSFCDIIVNFSSDLNFEELSKVTPLDLYCCVKVKKSKLEKGYEQLQELAVHFCRMANYQSSQI